MKKILIYTAVILWGFCFFPAECAEWKLTTEPNKVMVKGLSAGTMLAESGASVCNWYSAWGVELQTTPAGGLAVSKNIGESANILLAYEFPTPVTELQAETPVFRGVDLGNGPIILEYAVGKPENFAVLTEWNENSSQYVCGGELPPVESEKVYIPQEKADRLLFIRIRFEGYARQADFTSAGSISCTMTPDIEGKINLRLYPDNRKSGHIWRQDAPFRFMCSSEYIDNVVIREAVGGREIGNAVLLQQGGVLQGNLPELASGVYEMDFCLKDGSSYRYRFVLVPPPRSLTWEQKKNSPFGIVGISRTEGFREFRPVNGPAVAAMIGVHQERSSMGGWVNINGTRGEYNFGMTAEEVAEYVAETGILQRCNLAWTPDWAVDHERIRQDNYTGWTGHYPPREECYADYEEFCRRLAEHYGDSVVAEFEIWNEPNNEPFASFKGNFGEFVRLCETAADGIHSVNPEARMILGTTGDADVGFIARLLKAGLSEKFDIVDIHPYRHTSQGPEDGLLGDINRLKKAVELYGDDQDIIFSEVGWPTTRIDTGSYGKVTEFEQACFNTRTMLISLAAGVKRVHFHMMEDWGSNPDNPEENFGFFKVDGSPKLAVGAMAGTTRHLEGTTFTGRLDTGDFVHAWYWTTPWEKDMVLVTVWADMQIKSDPQDVVLPGQACMAFDMFGGGASHDRIYFEDGNTVVRPGADPVFIYMPADILPDLTELPADLRPWLKKRVEAPVADIGEIPDFGALRYPFSSGVDLKTMGFAGVESTSAKIAAETAVREDISSFDVCYDEESIRFSFYVKKDRPWSNDRSGWWVWAGDCIKIFLGRGEHSFMEPETYQLCFATTSASGKPVLGIISYDSVSGREAGEYMPAELYVERQDDCWLLSCRIFWADLGIKPEKGEVWSLDINGIAGFWNNPGSDCWTNPTRWGEVKFL